MLCSLLGRLVEFALSREEELLPMVGLDDAWAWLRRVALAAAIAVRRTFTFAELREVPVAEELVGDLGRLVQQLQLRLLLTDEDGRLRFSPRLLADELVAEALAEIEPSDGLLDALVPVVDVQLAGIRDDAERREEAVLEREEVGHGIAKGSLPEPPNPPAGQRRLRHTPVARRQSLAVVRPLKEGVNRNPRPQRRPGRPPA